MMRYAIGGLFVFLLAIVWIATRSVGEKPKFSVSNLKPDEVIVFFPAYGRFDSGQGSWLTRVHGNVHEPEYDSSKRATLIATLRVAANASVGIEDEKFLEDRLRPFLVDNERDKSISVQVAGSNYSVGTSEPNGHFSKTIRLSDNVPPPSSSVENTTLELQAVLPSDDQRRFTGRIHLIAPQGLSVISDIDDTIKLSHVTDKSELIKNTFLREFRDVEGMADIYTGLSKRGVAFHYVSGSVWQLYQPIAGFFSEAGFPRGTFHLKHFRLKDRSVSQLWSSQTEHKLNAINPIIADFPNRHLVLIGDSGEQDPEIYGEIARQYPDQIVGIFIRNATDESPDDERFEKAFRKIANNRWMLFDEANEIQASLDKLASEHASAQ